MSYDIHIVPRRPGQSWEEIEEQDEQEDLGPTGPLRPEEIDLWERLIGELTPLFGRALHDFRDAGCAELSDGETGLQVSLFRGSAAVTYPYWPHEDQAAFHRLVAETVATVCRLTGWDAYDPQTGDTFDGTPDDGLGLRATAWLGGGREGTAGPALTLPPGVYDVPPGSADVLPSGPAGPTGAAPGRQPVLPRPSRRRFQLYFWFGALGAPLSLAHLLLSGDQSGATVSAAPLGLSLFNLTMAWRIRSAMRRTGTW